jgi:hypothetical protein
VTRLERARGTARHRHSDDPARGCPGMLPRSEIARAAADAVPGDGPDLGWRARHMVMASLLLDGYPAKWRGGPPTGGER